MDAWIASKQTESTTWPLLAQTQGTVFVSVFAPEEQKQIPAPTGLRINQRDNDITVVWPIHANAEIEYSGWNAPRCWSLRARPSQGIYMKMPVAFALLTQYMEEAKCCRHAEQLFDLVQTIRRDVESGIPLSPPNK